MLYQIEQTNTKKNKKLVVVYVMVLLLVLFVSIGMGIVAATKVHKNLDESLGAISNPEQGKNNDTITLILNNQSESLAVDEKAFYNQVENIYNGKPGVKRVFLTFDDGPSDTVTPHILDVLKEKNVKATFFVLGTQISGRENLIKREYAEGHYVANHGYSHRYNKIYQSSKDVLKEYNKTEEEIKKALDSPNYESHLFRFPGGAYDGPYEPIKKKARKMFKKKHIAFLDWNALTYDADGADTKKEILDNLKETTQGKENIVLLMHDAADKKLTYETLLDVIEYLQKKGYSFKNMYDLMDSEEEYDI